MTIKTLKSLLRNTFIASVIVPTMLVAGAEKLNNPSPEYLNSLKNVRDYVVQYSPEKSIENSLKEVKKVVGNIESLITDKIIDAISQVESEGDSYAVSNKGAKGLMQITPIAWDEVNEKMGFNLDYDTHVHDPKINKMYGKNYFKILEKDYLKPFIPNWNKLSYKEQLNLTLASYNAGPTKVRKNNWDITKLPYETKNYVKKINKLVF